MFRPCNRTSLQPLYPRSRRLSERHHARCQARLPHAGRSPANDAVCCAQWAWSTCCGPPSSRPGMPADATSRRRAGTRRWRDAPGVAHRV